MLSLIVFLPLTALLVLAFLPGKWRHLSRYLHLTVVLGQIALFVSQILPGFWRALHLQDPELLLRPSDWMKLTERAPWITLNLGDLGRLQIDYWLALDGMNLWLMGLTLVIGLVAVAASWNVNQQPRVYHGLLLLLNTSVLGCFAAMDLFLFYIFYEFMLLPMYFLIGVWGGERRKYAAIKFFLYTLVGSVILLLVLLALYFSYMDPWATYNYLLSTGQIEAVSNPLETIQSMLQAGQLQRADIVHGFNLLQLSDPGNRIPESVLSSDTARFWAFVGLFIAFAIKLPVAPLHTWLPDAHVEASTPISVVLAAILLKVGGYGLLRLCYGLFPDLCIDYAAWLAGFGVFSILYGGLNAFAQTDMKRLIAYSSVSHMGYVLLGAAAFNSIGFTGAVLQMVNHGLVSAMLFLLVGVIYERVHNRDIANFSGLWTLMPKYTFFVGIAFFAGLGLPGLNTFVSEMFVLAAAFNASEGLVQLPWYFAGLGVLGILLSAAYFLNAFQRMFFGDVALRDDAWKAKLTDINLREQFMLALLAGGIVFLGVLPSLVVDWIDPDLNRFQLWAQHAAGLLQAAPQP